MRLGQRMKRLWPLILMCSLNIHAQAQTGAERPSTESVVQPFPNSTVVSSSFTPQLVHDVALGILQRESGIARPEQSQIVQGSLGKSLYEIPREFSGEAVFQFFERQFSEKGYQPLFDCFGRACGSSNDWANDIFGNRLLYGPVQNQFYTVFRQQGGDQLSPFISVYVITRGNRRLYAYVEVVKPSGAGFDSSRSELIPQASDLLGTELITYPALEFQDDTIIDSVELEDLRETLSTNPDLNIYIVSHLEGEAPLASLLARSQKRAESIMALLVSRGVAASRLSAHGLGPLAPACKEQSCRNRIEIVKR